MLEHIMEITLYRTYEHRKAIALKTKTNPSPWIRVCFKMSDFSERFCEFIWEAGGGMFPTHLEKFSCNSFLDTELGPGIRNFLCDVESPTARDVEIAVVSSYNNYVVGHKVGPSLVKIFYRLYPEFQV